MSATLELPELPEGYVWVVEKVQYDPYYPNRRAVNLKLCKAEDEWGFWKKKTNNKVLYEEYLAYKIADIDDLPTYLNNAAIKMVGKWLDDTKVQDILDSVLGVHK